jgi:hypothetical protein
MHLLKEIEYFTFKYLHLFLVAPAVQKIYGTYYLVRQWE